MTSAAIIARRPKMTAEQAKQFDGYSLGNSMAVRGHYAACGCSAYDDVFTMRRWNAQGFAVRRGEHGLRLPIVRERAPQDDDDGEAKPVRILGYSYVFCRHQVAPHERKALRAPSEAQLQAVDMDNLRSEVEALDSLLAADKAGELVKYVNRTNGHFGKRGDRGELTGLRVDEYRALFHEEPKTSIVRDGAWVPWEYAFDTIATELGFDGAEALKYAVEDHLRLRERRSTLARQLAIAGGA